MNLEKLLKLFAKYDNGLYLFWNEDLEFFVLCNDVFYWGVADLEPIETEEDIILLEKSFEEGGDDGAMLYCARKRNCRPQGTMYKHINKDKWHLFDAAGPEREIDMFNPKEKENEK